MGEWRVGIEIFVDGCGFIDGEVGVNVAHGEDATWKVTANRHEAYLCIEVGLEL